jgi:small subunit ribosomal protein S9
VKHGNGIFKINDKSVEAFLSEERDRNAVVAPLAAVSMTGKVDVLVTVDGGGFAGQAGAIVMGLARALSKLDSSLEAALRDGGFMTRDDRMVERKKPGMAGARKRFQFSKR